MGQQTDGVKFLVDLRATLIDCIKSIYGTEMTMSDKERMTATLKTMNNHLKSLLAHWFSVGFLTLEQITWNSSCSMLQRVSDYEAGKCDLRYFQTTLLIFPPIDSNLNSGYFKTDININITFLVHPLRNWTDLKGKLIQNLHSMFLKFVIVIK